MPSTAAPDDVVRPPASPRSPRGAGPRWSDAALALALGVAAVATARWAPPLPPYQRPDLVAYGLAVLACSTILVRRASPVPALGAASAVLLVHTQLGYPTGAMHYPVWVILFGVIAGTRSRRVARTAIAIAAGTAALYLGLDRGPLGVDVVVSIAMLFTVAVLGGELVPTRRALAEAARAQLRLERAQEADRAEHALLQDRARLARELHDSVGHAVNVMVMQAGVAHHVFDDRPEFARSALAHVESVGREALAELDTLLRVLRPDDEPPGERTTPSLAELEALCEGVRRTGQEVRLDVSPVALSAGSQRAAYRIVQEALTNAARHGDRSGPIEVVVAQAKGGVALAVRNSTAAGAPVRPGRGLRNMTERARLEGGRLVHRCDGGVFAIEVLLPTDDPARVGANPGPAVP